MALKDGFIKATKKLEKGTDVIDFSDASYADARDKYLVSLAFYNIASLVFGKNNMGKIEEFLKTFKAKTRIKTYPYDSKDSKYIGAAKGVPGICHYGDDLEKIVYRWLDGDINPVKGEKLEIELLGFSNNPRNSRFLEHAATHEFFHAFNNLLSDDTTMEKNGVWYRNMGSNIMASDKTRGKNVVVYGKCFTETFTDIMTTVALNINGAGGHNINVDKILKSRQAEQGEPVTGYTVVRSLTRLMIAAFSNVPDISYQDIIDKGYGIFNINVAGKDYKANDFLYGMMYNPLHIETKFDEIAGNGKYQQFCKSLDEAFMADKKTLAKPESIHSFMMALAEFVNKRMAVYIKRGKITEAEANKITSNFNEVFNSMQQEYSAYINQQDLVSLKNNANKYRS